MTDELAPPDFLDRRAKKGKPEPHTQRAHAKLAPSASHRWIECPGSVRLSEGIESKSSVYAAEGTAAHELAAHCLDTGADAEAYAERVIDIAGDGPATIFLMPGSPLVEGQRFIVDEEMIESVQLYLDYVRERVAVAGDGYELDVEQRLDMRHVHPEIWGTGDTVLYSLQNATLEIVDLKYGKGVSVDVEANPQLLTYALGAVRRYHNRGVDTVRVTVVQPRAPHADGPVRTYEIDVLDVMDFELDLIDHAKATEAPDAPLAAGEWCRFCPALPTCPTARERALAAALAEFAPQDGAPTLMKPEQLTDEQLADVLGEADMLNTWIKSVQQHAHDQATAGRCPPGYKLVAKRATRKWKLEEDEVRAKLLVDFDLTEEEILTEPSLKSPAQVEKVTGKKGFGAIEGELVAKVSSGTNLVPVTDSRPAVKAEGLEDFA